MTARWEIWIDTGGTFTDCLARDPTGQLHRAKVLSSSALRGRVTQVHEDGSLSIDARWSGIDGLVSGFEFGPLEQSDDSARVVRHHGNGRIKLDQAPPAIENGSTFQVRSKEPAPLLAARIVTVTPAREPLPPITMRLATTRGTNALLERRGAPTAFFVTRGFGDLLLIGDQQRPDLFALHIEKPLPLYEAVIEVSERVNADGSVAESIDVARACAQASEVFDGGIRSAAIALMHSYLNPEHERQLAGALRGLGFEHISCSSDLAPLIRLLPRAETAVVDAYLSPAINDHLTEVARGLSGGSLHVMTSAAGIVPADRYAARDSLLSGPAGGVAGAAAAGQAAGFAHIIGFDMGGTSTDVARFDGDFEYQFEHRVGGVRLLAPALAIETVAAGGGSICWYEGGRLRVGPESAGADPGPACYGAGGPLTLTDVNLLLGRLDPEQFAIPVDVEASRTVLEELKRRMREEVENAHHRPSPNPLAAAPDLRPEREGASAHGFPNHFRLSSQARDGESAHSDGALLDGLLEIADARMADAIAEVSIRRGYDPGDYALVSFGGAAGQHACSVAPRLGIRTIVMPADASLLSAYGLAHARLERFAQRQVLKPLDEVQHDLRVWLENLAAQARAELQRDHVAESDIIVRRRIINLRLTGQETPVPVDFEDNLPQRFRQRYLDLYGHEPEGRRVEVESLRVIVSTQEPALERAPSQPREGRVAPDRFMRARLQGRWVDVAAFERPNLPAGGRIEGPALVFDERSTYLIDRGWEAEICLDRSLIARSNPGPEAISVRPGVHGVMSPIRRTLFTNRFTSIARSMGQQLMRTAISTNVKERLDFSCALLDAEGHLLVNAPHLPVHLGALGICVRCLLKTIDMRPGDVVITNHPGFGGSHLPDITLVTPVFLDQNELIGFAANRAHHAEIGGRRPGSMPPDARSLCEEGVVIAPRHLVRDGRSRFDEVEHLLRSHPFPSRAVADNMADLRAQVAANQHGAVALKILAKRDGLPEIRLQMESISRRAEELTRHALSLMTDDRYDAVETLDDGSPLHVSIVISGDRATVDFTGSAPQHPGNLNATPAIVRSVILYVLRLLIGEPARDEPMNEGMMRPITLILPPGMLNPAFASDDTHSPAVVGGNTETSQRLTNLLLKALRLCAGSQGTMNNVLFGSTDFGYYETVCGGSGAGRGFAGADAVHTHMTNTRITDPELLEHRFPVVVERFAIRRGSGGAGRYRGGDGVERIYRFNAHLSLSVLAQHRREGPSGLEGGEPGAAGRHWLIRRDGSEEELKSIDGREVEAGDRFVLQTPGGGGFGSAIA